MNPRSDAEALAQESGFINSLAFPVLRCQRHHSFIERNIPTIDEPEESNSCSQMSDFAMEFCSFPFFAHLFLQIQ
jgi:hypothetical protein